MKHTYENFKIGVTLIIIILAFTTACTNNINNLAVTGYIASGYTPNDYNKRHDAEEVEEIEEAEEYEEENGNSSIIEFWYFSHITPCEMDMRYGGLRGEASYDMLLVSSEYLLDLEKLPWAEERPFKIVQVANVADKGLEQKINESIIEATTHWVGGWLANALMSRSAVIGPPKVIFHSDRYLSFANTFHGPFSVRADTFADFITIDMETGQRVMLNDLVIVNEELAAVLYSWPEVAERLLWVRHINITTHYELLSELNTASLKREEEYGGRTSFFLRTNQLIIVFHAHGGDASWPESLPHFVINLEDIQDFLKVEPW